MFEFLFKYPLEHYQRGELLLAQSPWTLALLPFAAAALLLLLLAYARLRRRTRPARLLALISLRAGAIGVLLFALAQPVLEVTAEQPQANLVAVLVDDSLSMRIADQQGAARGDYARAQLDLQRGELLSALGARYDTRLFAFGAGTRPLEDGQSLAFAAGSSDLAGALEAVQATLAGEPLAGIVLLTDGAVATGGELETALRELRAGDIALHPVGLGAARWERDIEISALDLPDRVLGGSRVAARVTVEQQGYDGQTVELVIENDSRILARHPVELRAGRQVVAVPLVLDEGGAHRLRARIDAQPGEQLADNNRLASNLQVEDQARRILYFEGEPRYEVKFLRRALADDEALRLVGLIRTADAKYYRLGVETRDALERGFPRTAAELFAYDVLILGSVEATLLSAEQQQHIVDFVSRRGGGLVLLGGRHAFAEGGYLDSPLRELFPVIMESRADPGFRRVARIRPTTAAWSHPALRLQDEHEENRARWLTLPPLTLVNPLRAVKPGAELLLTGEAAGDEAPWVVMAAQRYGRGRVLAFAVQNSWLWQMHQDIDLADQTHENLWRQLLRWLATEPPTRLTLGLERAEVAAGDRLQVRGTVFDDDYGDSADAAPQLLVLQPDGSERRIAMTRHPSMTSTWEATVDAADIGDYRLRLASASAESELFSAEARFSATRAGNEYRDARRNDALLQRLAAATGGVAHRPGDWDGLVASLATQQRGARLLQRHELWDMPAIFLALTLLLIGEWALRRRVNLV